MKHPIIVGLVLVYIFMSAFLEIGLGKRVVLADLLLVGLIGMAVLLMINRNSFVMPSVHRAALPMLLVFLFSAFFAYYPDRAIFELIIILFSFFGSIAIVNLVLQLPEVWLFRLTKGYMLAIGLLSLLCLVDFFFMPGLISSKQVGGLQGPFRNTGQAGSFLGVHGTIMLALLIGGLVPRRFLYLLATVSTLAALLFTIKRSSTFAMVVGLVFLVVFLVLSPSVRDKKIGVFAIIGMILLSFAGYLIFIWALAEVPLLTWRFEYKISAEAVDNYAQNFFLENLNSALAAFNDYPLLGTGLGNVNGVYQYHEIHSTYLGILAYGGIMGSLAYFFFMGSLTRAIYIESRKKLENAWASFLYYLLPLLFGQMIGWGYTFHVRKREFWVLVVFITVAIMISKKSRYTSRLASQKFCN